MYELQLDVIKRKRNIDVLIHKRKMRKLLRDKETRKFEGERFLEHIDVLFKDYVYPEER